MQKPGILIIHGPNLNMLGVRQPEIYGNVSFETYLEELHASFDEVSLGYYQSNHEGDLIDCIQESPSSYRGIIINPGAYTHTSVAIRDALTGIQIPVIEVHLSNIYAREEFRRVSLIKDVCVSSFVGFGMQGYKMAIERMMEFIKAGF
ncbi:MAG: type II 3-dehydroquinate dehydratase [Saprospiraceae bacterium]|nr:type II 3-dehydroquinate dehydratase [Saprospiraceae bacterium]HRG33259.1 type II 3-dehydroquinate dehydratase [Saprospiraceae bacterium]